MGLLRAAGRGTGTPSLTGFDVAVNVEGCSLARQAGIALSRVRDTEQLETIHQIVSCYGRFVRLANLQNSYQWTHKSLLWPIVEMGRKQLSLGSNWQLGELTLLYT
jgi:hypothetical protein